MEQEAAAKAMQAAVAAAAELAKNGGMNLFMELTSANGSDRVYSKDGTSCNHMISTKNGNNKKHNENNEKRLQDDQDDDDNNERNGLITSQQREEEEIVPSSTISSSSCSMEEEDAEEKLARSRERNREHARRTRLRKKAQLEALQSKVKTLEAESRLLRQSLEECSIASILIGMMKKHRHNLHNLAQPNDHQVQIQTNDNITQALLNASQLQKISPKVSLVVGGKRKRFISEDAEEKQPQPLKLNIDGQITFIGGGKTHINWKSGVYCDEHGVQRQLTHGQLESLRRERNRMHAKMTRDRKKCFIAAIEKNIEELENQNKRMRDALTQVAKHHFGPKAVTPMQSPVNRPLKCPKIHPSSSATGPVPVDIQAELALPPPATASSSTPTPALQTIFPKPNNVPVR